MPNNLKTLVLAFGVCAAIALSSYAVLHRASPAAPGEVQNQQPKYGYNQAEPYICFGTYCTWNQSYPCGVNGTIASSTIFAIQNPWSASSTVYMTILGTQGATTSDIIVATSTTPAPATGIATSSLNASFFGAASIATSTNFYLSSGNSASFLKAAYNNTAEIVVGPSEYVLGFSTSTTGGSASNAGKNGGTAAGQVAVPASCSVELTWTK